MDQVQELTESIRYLTEQMEALTENIGDYAKAVHHLVQLNAALIESSLDDEEEESGGYLDGTH